MKQMTSKNHKDWIDEILEDDECTCIQIGIIESLLITSSSSKNYQNININTLTYNEAEEIIRDLRENNVSKDPRDQFDKMFKSGCFK